MKILHIYAQKPGFTGSGYYLKNILNEGAKKSVEQAIIAGIEKNSRDKYQLRGCSEFFPVYFSSNKLPFPVVGMSDQMPYKSTLYSDLKGEKLQKWKNAFSKNIKKAIKNFKPDLVISHHLWLLTALSTKYTEGINHIAVCHGTGLRKFKQLEKHQKNVKTALNKVDKIIALNFQQKKEINQLMGIDNNKIKVIGNGFNPKIFYPLQTKQLKKEKEAVELLYAGKISRAKGLLALLESFSHLNKKYSINLTLCGGGCGSDFKNIKSAAAETGNNIIFTGIIPQKKLAEKMRQSDIFVLPSYYEGLPLVIIEALASGLRVVTTDLPGIRDWLGPELIKCGVVQFVKPPLCGKDCLPYSAEIPEFIKRLTTKLEKQLISVKEKQPPDHSLIQKYISRKSWSSVFEKLIKLE
ncbi:MULTISPECIES: glycosyltransferase family 4 protein [unclassified Halanaerobium]|uniref:glycosyltransferase family 4 protein n=1 Tax=unclassified Halanaerobium TaxID=2641197 RepID=UPI000DF3535E|nr:MULTISPECIES: glycosyltransferase family 4 protein [unclassified Halanaerobium]RCW40288.1 glycosyl transferase family 4 [Halanaerobium sp. MA284_MarDTE_T2]RCW79865.1 glycosyl transferase family 4 [Halanaerobium sp. DL-01]